MARLGEAKEAIAAGSTLESVAEDLGLEIKESNEFGKRDSVTGLGRATELIAAALGSEEGAMIGPFEDPQGAVLAEVVTRTTFDASAFEEAKEETRIGQESQKVQQLLGSLIELRRRDLEPKHNADLLASFEIDTLEVG